MVSREDQILVFDSGLGGLSVLRELRQLLPRERFLYFGDSAHAPYGTRPTAQVRELTLSALEPFWKQDVKAVVVACNTATAAAIFELRQAHGDRVIIGMEPALKPAASRHPKGRILVMATGVTLREQKFCSLMDRFSTQCRIVPLPCPGLVELIESGQVRTPAVRARLRELLEPAMQEQVDAVVLGCTHFPFLRPVLRELLGSGVEILDGAPGAARQTLRRLEQEYLLRLSGLGSVELRNSSSDPALLEISARLLGEQYS